MIGLVTRELGTTGSLAQLLVWLHANLELGTTELIKVQAIKEIE
jgi:hypothetical protein